MNPLDWLKKQEPGFRELSPQERNAIMQFSLLWSLFEANALDTRGNAKTIVASAERWAADGVLTQEAFEAESAYFRVRYFADGTFTDHFRHLHLRPADKAELVEKFLKNECEHLWETAAGLLIIVYRFRNNLFHGLKWAYNIQGQRDNFNHANAALMQAIELD